MIARSGADGKPLSADADHAGHVRDGADPPVARVAHRLASPLRRTVRGLLRDGLHGRLRGLTTPWVRFLPVGKAIEAHPMALPSDQLEVVLDQFDTFAVGQCQCRIATEAVGRGCGKPKGNCAVMGRGPRSGIEGGSSARSASRKCSTSSARPRPTAWSTG